MDTADDCTIARRDAMRHASCASLGAFLCHPLLYTLDPATQAFAAPDARPYGRVLGAQAAPAASEHYPNKATAWVRAHFSHVCAANFAVLSRGDLLSVDLLVRNPDAPVLSGDAGDFTAVFIVFSDGCRTLYNRAVQHVLRARAAMAREYAFFPSCLLLHVTRSGALRRKWL
jgi:hypothetical protein